MSLKCLGDKSSGRSAGVHQPLMRGEGGGTRGDDEIRDRDTGQQPAYILRFASSCSDHRRPERAKALPARGTALPRRAPADYDRHLHSSRPGDASRRSGHGRGGQGAVAPLAEQTTLTWQVRHPPPARADSERLRRSPGRGDFQVNSPAGPPQVHSASHITNASAGLPLRAVPRSRRSGVGSQGPSACTQPGTRP